MLGGWVRQIWQINIEETLELAAVCKHLVAGRMLRLLKKRDKFFWAVKAIQKLFDLLLWEKELRSASLGYALAQANVLANLWQKTRLLK
jgi:hypothetical protein